MLPKPRRVRFPMPTSTKRQHFVDGDLVMSHFISVLSATFPEGEDFFIRSVRNFQSSIDDPQLDTAVKGFIGQEATHRHQHRLLNERLQVMGYPTARIDRHVARLIKRLERRFSPEMRLSMTSALEHYTATWSTTPLRWQKSFLPAKTPRSSSDRQRFDRFCCGMPSMRIASVILFGELILQTALSMAADKASYNPVTLVRSLYRFSRTPMFTADALRRFRSYNRPGFHPDDWDSAAVLEHWSKELFDQDGSQRVIASSG